MSASHLIPFGGDSATRGLCLGRFRGLSGLSGLKQTRRRSALGALRIYKGQEAWKRSAAGAFQPLPSFFQMCMRDSASTTAWYNSSICTFKEMSVSEAQAELLNMTEQFPQTYMHETSAPHSECSTIRAIGVVSAVLPAPRAVEQATGCTAGYWLRRRRRIPLNIIAAATEVAMTAMVAIMRRRWGRGPPRPRASWTEVNHEPS